MLSPLSGVKVLDFTRILAGPFCTMLLGDLGATVIKIERPGTGDDTRTWKPPEVNGQSCYFLCVNRNKQSVAIDLKNAKGLNVVKKLAYECDVLVENFIPDTMDRLGLGYNTLKATNPSLIYCSISGYGPSGPYARRGGYDVIAAAIGGMLHVTGPEKGEPCKAGTAVTDIGTGLYAHGAIMAALLQRYKTGLGQKIDCNLLSTQVSVLINIASNYLNSGVEGRRLGTAHESIVPYQGFQTSDGNFVVGGGNDKQFEELCILIDRIDLITNKKYCSNVLRVKNRRELIADLQSVFITKSNEDWMKIFKNARMPFGPVNNIEQVFNDPQVQHNQMVQTVHHDRIGSMRLLAPAVKFSDSENSIRTAPPLLGQHTEDVLKNILKFGDDEIRSLVKEKVVQLA